MSSTITRTFAVLVVAALTLAACGDDDDAQPELPEGGTGSAYNDAIIEADSHDEIIFAGGGDMVVAVNCGSETGGTIVTAVAEGLEPGIYTGEFDPGTGVGLTLEVTGPGYAIAASQMTLDAEEYTVTFADIEGGEFSVNGCPG
jgi:hypothetical protein